MTPEQFKAMIDPLIAELKASGDSNDQLTASNLLVLWGAWLSNDGRGLSDVVAAWAMRARRELAWVKSNDN